MAEVIDFRSGETWTAAVAVPASVRTEANGLAGKILSRWKAFQNDRTRKNLSVRKLNFSYHLKGITNELDISVVKEICDKVRFAPYGDIGFWTLSEHLVSAETREKAEKDHLMGLFQVGNKPATGIIWKLKPEMKRIDLFSAEEVFENAPI